MDGYNKLQKVTLRLKIARAQLTISQYHAVRIYNEIILEYDKEKSFYSFFLRIFIKLYLDVKFYLPAHRDFG